MTAKAELQAIRALDGRVAALQAKREWLSAKAERATSHMDGVRVVGGSERSRVENSVCQLVDYDRNAGIAALLDELIARRSAVREVIREMPTMLHREVLTLRYVEPQSELWTWERIAAEMGVSLRYCLKLHGWALIEFERVRG